MALVNVEIDGRPVTADDRQTILEAARAHAISTIPTLCHDRQLEPFASCFVCVVAVKGAPRLLPACSTRVSAGMVIETGSAEVRAARRAALELLLSDHYADCVGPCRLACPAGVDIQGYIALAALGRFRDAIALIKQTNPLPSVCGRVCTRPCEVKGCRRTLVDEPVGIDYIKRYVADLELDDAGAHRPSVAPPSGKRVAVVGAGPAGLAAAYYLAVRGHGVEILEAQPAAGGMLRYGIPEYRLPKDVLDREIAQILALGPTLVTGRALGKDFTLASLRQDGFDAVFLAIGAWRSALMRVQNEDAEGVLSGIDFLRQVGLGRPPSLHGVVAVVGGGNTAIDCARTALRLGAAEVRLLYRRTRAEMPANDAEIRDAIEEGVQPAFLVAPTRVLTEDGRLAGLECQRMELGEPDASGRRSPRPIAGSEFTAPCDVVIAAIGQSATIADLADGRVPGFLPAGQALGLTRWQTVQVDERTGETTVEGVFSGGDVVTGAATAIEAIAAGRRAAFAMDAYLREGRSRPEPREFFSRKDALRPVSVEDLRSRVPRPRRAMPLVPAVERVTGFAEVETGYSADDLAAEATRCLECGCSALFDCALRRYATEYGVELTRFVGEARRHERDASHPLIELDPNKCILCGRCVRMCGDVVGASAFGFVNRGFGTVVAPALGGSLLDAGCVSCGLCLATCPTGAIAEKLPLAKPGPWATRQTPSVCHYCGVGCRIAYDTHGDVLVKVSRDEADAVTFGHHCRKGRFGARYVADRGRLVSARRRAGGRVEDVPLDDAIELAARGLEGVTARHSGRAVAVLVSPRMTNEEIYLAQKLARAALGTHNVASFSQLLNPALLAPAVLATATYRDLAGAEVILTVNSGLADEHFVVDLVAKRAIRGGARLVSIAPAADRTTALAEVFLRCRPGAETLVLQAVVAEHLRRPGEGPAWRPAAAGEASGLAPAELEALTGVPAAAVARAAGVLSGGLRRVLVFNRDYRGVRRPHDAQLIAASASALRCLLLPLHEKANAQGLLDMGAHPAWYPGYRAVSDGGAVEDLEREWGVPLRHLDTRPADILRRLADGTIRGALVLGEDPLALDDLPEALRAGLESLEWLVVADVFATRTASAAHVVLPMSAAAETSGTMTNSERRVQGLVRAVPPRAGRETREILAGLAARLGLTLESDPARVLEEIRRVAPIFRHVRIGSEDADGLWDLGQAGTGEGGGDAVPGADVVTPVRTAALDCLDARFDEWFAALAGPRPPVDRPATGGE